MSSYLLPGQTSLSPMFQCLPMLYCQEIDHCWKVHIYSISGHFSCHTKWMYNLRGLSLTTYCLSRLFLNKVVAQLLFWDDIYILSLRSYKSGSGVFLVSAAPKGFLITPHEYELRRYSDMLVVGYPRVGLAVHVVCSFSFPFSVIIAIYEVRENCHMSSDSQGSGEFENSRFGVPSTQMISSLVSGFHSFSCPNLGRAPYLDGEFNLPKRLTTLMFKSWPGPQLFQPFHYR